MIKELGLVSAKESLEALRADLEAQQLTARFDTSHGAVDLVAEPDRFSIRVDGAEVPVGR